jgi:hypothetical protein
MKSETSANAKVSQEKDQLLEEFFEAVNDLCRGVDIRDKTPRVIDLKRKLTQLDPSWKFTDFNNCHVFRILSHLDELYTENVVPGWVNEDLCLKIRKEIRKMQVKIPWWSLNREVMLQFLNANSERNPSSSRHKTDRSVHVPLPLHHVGSEQVSEEGLLFSPI